MKCNNAVSQVAHFSNIIDYLDILLYNRPIPHREYDQIYMKARSMLEQVEYVKEYIGGKRIVFLGDGDGMSILFALLSQIEPFGAKELAVFDFDERILNAYKRIRTQQRLDIPMHYELYNIINPVKNRFCNQYDFFYINPPYGSKNNGLSCILWISRCMELTTADSEGCIIIPYDETIPWSMNCVNEIFSFLKCSGFEIIRIIKSIHKYHLDDKPSITSSAILVKRTTYVNSAFSESRFPAQMCKNLYGATRPIPQYIYDSESSPLGICDFDWEYGNINYFLVD